MYLDKQLQMGEEQSVIASADALIPTTYSIDTTVAGNGIPNLQLEILLTTTFLASAGAANVTFFLETHTADDFTAHRTVLWKSAAIAKATLVAGYVIKVPVPIGMLRYLSVVAVPDTHDLTAGAMSCYLVKESDHAI